MLGYSCFHCLFFCFRVLAESIWAHFRFGLLFAVTGDGFKTKDTIAFKHKGMCLKAVVSFVLHPSPFAISLTYGTLYISDSIPPKSVKAMTVLVTSPLRENWKEFLKEPGSRMLHFPMYSYSEMCALRSECFSHMDLKTMDDRYAVWGGNPRPVMTMSHVSIAKFASEIRSFDYSSLARTVCNVDVNVPSESVSHRMMHIKIAGETDSGEGCRPCSLEFYELDRIEFASRFVSAIVYERICEVRNEELLALIRNTDYFSKEFRAGRMSEHEGLGEQSEGERGAPVFA